ncbi:FusA-like translation elongation factor [Encephalitozoon romaleae SJ-2008]|uniref:FusA-like translation elongation factor n=1 Tax=Encephalitozoon romaleae (strain SJ-2008) TaxID=1178016 RepID=I7ATG3_ENCRO|nr:FusA-like translation elongation factor [Encephalitozoon romaleae SJ-2008]AFN83737.1 FusA-like translation elongation factor [Encephalitozoon romaleae SJ-2008]
MTLLDTPGHSDLIHETTKAIECIDIAVVVLDICCDLSLQYEVVFNAIAASKKPLIIVLNKTDLIGRDFASFIKKKIEHLRSIVEEKMCPRGWFAVSSKYGSLSRIKADVYESNEKSEDVLNELIEEIFCLEPTKHNYNDEERFGGFLWAGGTILFGLVPKADFNAGSTIKVYGTDLAAEKLYIPFPGCLVETRAVKANIGVLVKFQEGLLQKIELPNNQKVLGHTIKKVLEDKGLMCTDSELLEVVDPVIRVQVSPSDEDIFLREVWKLRLIYPGLKIGKKSLCGNGELLMDAVLYDLRNKLNVEFQVLSVSSNLKEIFKDSFREVVETGKGLLTVEGGVTRDIDEDHKFSGYIEKQILSKGPLIKEPFSHSYLAISPEPLELDFECFRKIEDSIVKHVTILEPLYLVEIVYTSEAEDLVNEMIKSSFGEVIRQKSFPFSMLKSILCYIPVPESFGFETDLRVYSCSKADCIKIPLYWRPVSDKSRAASLTRFMRKTKRFELHGN